MKEIRTSLTHPLVIDELRLNSYTDFNGVIGMSFCAGKCHASQFGNYQWQRDLDADIQAIKHWGADIWLNLMEDEDLISVGIDPDYFLESIEDAGMQYVRFPIVDGSVPDEASNLIWKSQLSPMLINELKNGRKLFIHCRGGLGRTGLIAAKLLVELGLEPEQAISITRQVRKGAIENKSQEHWVY